MPSWALGSNFCNFLDEEFVSKHFEWSYTRFFLAKAHWGSCFPNFLYSSRSCWSLRPKSRLANYMHLRWLFTSLVEKDFFFPPSFCCGVFMYNTNFIAKNFKMLILEVNTMITLNFWSYKAYSFWIFLQSL